MSVYATIMHERDRVHYNASTRTNHATTVLSYLYASNVSKYHGALHFLVARLYCVTNNSKYLTPLVLSLYLKYDDSIHKVCLSVFFMENVLRTALNW